MEKDDKVENDAGQCDFEKVLSFTGCSQNVACKSAKMGVLTHHFA